jgi:predicted transcriptional regulator
MARVRHAGEGVGVNELAEVHGREFAALEEELSLIFDAGR